MNTPNLLKEAAQRVTPALLEVLQRMGVARPEDGADGAHRVAPELQAAMHYALTSPGKRLRPALVLGGAHAVGARFDDVLPAACAVEMVHAYSLVHDDLPCLDDDDERRGQPSTHKRFGEATALLAGDALLTEALGLVADGQPLGEGRAPSFEARALATVALARASGAAGMVGGQQDDLTFDLATRPAGSKEMVLSIHQRKTGRLIQASVALGGIYGGGSPDQVEALRQFGAQLGLAFQLVDDALDVDGFAALQGADAARALGAEYTEAALGCLDIFGERASGLRALANIMLERLT